ncbi:MAG TPA: Spy/CpxP family protein refolding chaperone [Pseudolabrys sp.]|nr:Spy/CpxP family protein refolding chaperone [Pseudolabrys sp.]
MATQTPVKATPQAASKATPNTAAATQQTTRQQQRAERAQRRQEARELRNTPRGQRAAKREEIRNARELRAQQRQQANRPNAAATTGSAPANATTTRAQRRAARLAARGITPVTAQAARNGRFASQFATTANARNSGRWHGRDARYAWRHGWLAGFVPWYGPVFWPYAYSDIFDYAFWPYGYDDGFWDYAYDDFIDGVFWGGDGAPAEYAYASPPPPQANYATVRTLCSQPGSGVTAWPFADIKRKVGLNEEQKGLLGDMRKAADEAAAVFKTSCPADNAFPLTPPGRLQAMTSRLQATLQAVDTVRPALEKFYGSLSDEQKERFNELGPSGKANNAEAKAALPTDAKACSEAKPGLTNLPIERISESVDTTDEQDALLTKLSDAMDNAVSILQSACPEEAPLTPPGRLEAMEKRLQAMIDAANAVKPALTDFYAALSPEQKARFNQIGKDVASKE